jgi:hypothetical protein
LFEEPAPAIRQILSRRCTYQGIVLARLRDKGERRPCRSSYHQQLSSSLVIGKVAAQRDERTFSQSSSNRTARARIPEGN